MPKTRLTKYEREEIRDAIIGHKFNPIFAAIEADKAALARAIYDHAYDKKAQASMAALGKGAFITTDRFEARVDGQRHMLRAATALPLYYDHHYGSLLNVRSDDAHGQQVLALSERDAAARKERTEMSGVVSGTLSQFLHFEDLIAAWPEAESFVRSVWAERGDGSIRLPSVKIGELSAALDLPPETQAA